MQRQEQRIAPLPASLQNCGTAVLVGSARAQQQWATLQNGILPDEPPS
ncbi:hypothetical protein PpBr36_06845 [Pyricularia pennisetigena]|nr:hypothetical protein PpBr36_06845 [Pyricularia pennisetigena]TLS26005.1 hypothetical protein PpBr36_06845 [Pyricularia pennisetigena]